MNYDYWMPWYDKVRKWLCCLALHRRLSVRHYTTVIASQSLAGVKDTNSILSNPLVTFTLTTLFQVKFVQALYWGIGVGFLAVRLCYGIDEVGSNA
jgi:hypothetical protein